MKKIISSKIFVHAGFCIAVIALSWFAIHFYIGDMRSNEAQLGCVASLYFFICVYTGRWLTQTWLLRNKFGLFLLYAILTCIVLIVAGGLLVQARFHLHDRNLTDFFLRISPFFIISYIIGIFLKLARAAMQEQVQDAKASAEQKQSELNLLQSQLSPHFLFNTLNNIYVLSISHHDKIPGLLLKLSDLLRYSVYNTQGLFVLLIDELAYVTNYIDFEKIRIGDRLVLTTAIEDIPDTIKIAPMVLIIFIENAFKHAKDTLDQKIHIDISVKIVDNFILFSVRNSQSIIQHDDEGSKGKSGLGLINTIKRLELLYPGEYNLDQRSEEKFYNIVLRIKVK